MVHTFLSAVGDLGPASAAPDHMPQHIITFATSSDVYTSGVHYKTPLELSQVASAGGGTHMIRAIDTFRTLLQAIASGHTTTATIRLIVLSDGAIQDRRTELKKRLEDVKTVCTERGIRVDLVLIRISELADTSALVAWNVLSDTIPTVTTFEYDTSVETLRAHIQEELHKLDGSVQVCSSQGDAECTVSAGKTMFSSGPVSDFSCGGAPLQMREETDTERARRIVAKAIEDEVKALRCRHVQQGTCTPEMKQRLDRLMTALGVCMGNEEEHAAMGSAAYIAHHQSLGAFRSLDRMVRETKNLLLGEYQLSVMSAQQQAFYLNPRHQQRVQKRIVRSDLQTVVMRLLDDVQRIVSRAGNVVSPSQEGVVTQESCVESLHSLSPEDVESFSNPSLLLHVVGAVGIPCVCPPLETLMETCWGEHLKLIPQPMFLSTQTVCRRIRAGHPGVRLGQGHDAPSINMVIPVAFTDQEAELFRTESMRTVLSRQIALFLRPHHPVVLPQVLEWFMSEAVVRFRLHLLDNPDAASEYRLNITKAVLRTASIVLETDRRFQSRLESEDPLSPAVYEMDTPLTRTLATVLAYPDRFRDARVPEKTWALFAFRHRRQLTRNAAGKSGPTVEEILEIPVHLEREHKHFWDLDAESPETGQVTVPQLSPDAVAGAFGDAVDQWASTLPFDMARKIFASVEYPTPSSLTKVAAYLDAWKCHADKNRHARLHLSETEAARYIIDVFEQEFRRAYTTRRDDKMERIRENQRRRAYEAFSTGPSTQIPALYKQFFFETRLADLSNPAYAEMVLVPLLVKA